MIQRIKTTIKKKHASNYNKKILQLEERDKLIEELGA
jgi:hypothetical protein